MLAGLVWRIQRALVKARTFLKLRAFLTLYELPLPAPRNQQSGSSAGFNPKQVYIALTFRMSKFQHSSHVEKFVKSSSLLSVFFFHVFFSTGV